MKIYKPSITLLLLLQLLTVANAQKEEKQLTTVRSARNWQETFTLRPALFFDRALMGEETGVYISNGGFTGNSGNLLIRGINTVNLNASPYVIVGGMSVRQTRSINPFVTGLIENNWGFINPQDIKELKIIKGGYDASFYGGKSGNGLIYVDFDRGELGSATIDVTARAGFSQADYSLNLLNSEQFRGYLYTMMESKGMLPTDLQSMKIFDPAHPKYNHNTNWMNLMTGDGFFHDYNLKMKGGDGDTKYLFSLSYASEDETLKQSDYQRFNMRFNLDYRISPKISISNSLSYNYGITHFQDEGSNWDLNPVYLSATKAPFLSPNYYSDEGVEVQRKADYDELGKSNPLAFKDNLKNKGVENRIDAIIKAKWDIAPAFYAVTNINVSYNAAVEKQHRGAEGIVAEEYRKRQNSKRNFSEFLLHWDISLAHNGKINPNLKYQTAAGMALETYNEKMVYGRRVNASSDEMESLPYGTLDSMTNQRYDYKQLNFFANGSIHYGKLATLAANLNLERSSNFGPNGNWNLYAGANLNFNLLQTVRHAVNIDIQWGRTGNNDIRGAYYSQLYVPTSYYAYGGVYLGNLQKNDLKPEITNNIDATIRTALWQHRLDLSIGYYYRQTNGLLTQRSVPIELGLDPQFENNGKVLNQGIEFSAHIKVLRTPKTDWEIFANISTLTNEVKALKNGDIVNTTDKFTAIAREGEELGSFFGYKVKGIYSGEKEITMKRTDGTLFQPGDYEFEDINKDGIINSKDRQIIGSPLPDFFGGFGTNFHYKNLTINALFTYSYGNDVYNLFNQKLCSMEDYSNQSSAVLHRWISPEVQGEGLLPRAAYGDPSGNFTTSDRWVEDGSYLKFKSVSVGYNVPLKNRNGFIKGIHVFANANNLFTLTGYKGFDPEVFSSVNPLLRGVDMGGSPNPRSYIFGIRLSL